MQNQKTQKQSMSKQSTPKPFCKVCYDAGKTSAEYSTHYVRESRGGAVICPTLLSQECKYCKKIGHTPSHCPVLLVKAQAKQVQAPAKQSPTQAPAQAQQSQVQAPAKQSQEPAPAAQQAPTKEETQARAARLCESPPPQNEKPVFVMKTWASAVSKKAEPTQAQAPAAQAQAPAAQAQAQAQAPAPAAQAPAAEAPAFNYFNISWADVE